jgi:hypothetical protein
MFMLQLDRAQPPGTWTCAGWIALVRWPPGNPEAPGVRSGAGKGALDIGGRGRAGRPSRGQSPAREAPDRRRAAAPVDAELVAALTALRKRQLEESTTADAAYGSRVAELDWYRGGEYVITDQAGSPRSCCHGCCQPRSAETMTKAPPGTSAPWS